MDLVYKGGPTHCVQNALGGWLKSAFNPTYTGVKPTMSFVGIENLGRKSTNLAKPLLCLRSCLRSSRAFRPEPRGGPSSPCSFFFFVRSPLVRPF
jgi:hypothetical protein